MHILSIGKVYYNFKLLEIILPLHYLTGIA
jgi:hypothetical protein